MPLRNYQALLLYHKGTVLTVALKIRRIYGMTKEKRLLEMFLLCWQRYEIKQVNQSSGSGQLQGSASAVSVWTCAHISAIIALIFCLQKL
jgi:hypothetical protein